MDADGLKVSLKAIGWKGSDLARKVGVGTSTVSRWMNGDPIPPWVDAYLGAMGELDRLHRAFVRVGKPTRVAPDDDAHAPASESGPSRAARAAQRIKSDPDLFAGGQE